MSSQSSSTPNPESESLDESKQTRFRMNIPFVGRRLMVANISIDPGDLDPGAKCWIKMATLLDPTKGGGRGVIGNFLSKGNQHSKSNSRNYCVAGNEGMLLVARAVSGSSRHSTSNTLVLRLKLGAKVDLQYDHQRFVGTGVEVLKIAKTGQQELQLFPGLEASKAKWSEIYAILRAAGVPQLTNRSKPQVG